MLYYKYILPITILIFTGCQEIKEPTINMKKDSIAILKLKREYEIKRQKELNDGSISISDDFSLLSNNTKKVHVGDSIIITIKEDILSQSNNKNILNKNSNIGISGGAVTSNNIKAQGLLNKIVNPLTTLGINSSKENSFSGKVDNATREKFNATITGLLTEKITNSLYKVEATKTLLINNEKKQLLLYGYIHISNIGEDKMISSDKILNLRVQYKSAGDMTDTLEKGSIQRIMDKLF